MGQQQVIELSPERTWTLLCQQVELVQRRGAIDAGQKKKILTFALKRESHDKLGDYLVFLEDKGMISVAESEPFLSWARKSVS